MMSKRAGSSPAVLNEWGVLVDMQLGHAFAASAAGKGEAQALVCDEEDDLAAVRAEDRFRSSGQETGVSP